MAPSKLLGARGRFRRQGRRRGRLSRRAVFCGGTVADSKADSMLGVDSGRSPPRKGTTVSVQGSGGGGTSNSTSSSSSIDMTKWMASSFSSSSSSSSDAMDACVDGWRWSRSSANDRKSAMRASKLASWRAQTSSSCSVVEPAAVGDDIHVVVVDGMRTLGAIPVRARR